MPSLAAFLLVVSNNKIEAFHEEPIQEQYFYTGMAVLNNAITAGVINYCLSGNILGGAVLGSLAALNERAHMLIGFPIFSPFLSSIIGRIGYDLTSAFVKKRSITSPTIPLCCSALSGIAACIFQNRLDEKKLIMKLSKCGHIVTILPLVIVYFSVPLIFTSIVSQAFKLKVHPVTYIVEALLPMLDVFLKLNEDSDKVSCILETSLSAGLGLISCLVKGFKKSIKN